jgi:Uma2 family endonuclease
MAPFSTTRTGRRRPPRGPLSYEAFLEWTDEDTRAEWVDGEVFLMSPASTRHQDIADFLTATLRLFVEHHDAGRVLSAPFQMKLENGREPDVLFVARDHLDRLQDTYLDGPADLVIEIVSPESGPRDRGDTFYEYEAGGVREYWLIDPARQQVELYRLGDDRQYRSVQPTDADRYESAVVPGMWLRASWLWQAPLPKVLDVARQWGIVG